MFKRSVRDRRRAACERERERKKRKRKGGGAKVRKNIKKKMGKCKRKIMFMVVGGR